MSSPSHPTTGQHQRTVVVIAGGDPLPVEASRALKAARARAVTTIAADSGLDEACRAGVLPDRVVGDLDSVEPDSLEQARAAGVRIDTYPRDKDRTDLAIALDTAMESRPETILMFGGSGGRLDHLLGNAALLAADAYAKVEITAWIGNARLYVVHAHRERPTSLEGRIGELISLLPFHGTVHGVTTTGLAFPLDQAQLDAGSSLGVSNRFAARTASVSVTRGVLLAIQPGSA